MIENWMYPFDKIITGHVGIRMMRLSSVNYPECQQGCVTFLHDNGKAQHKITTQFIALSSNAERSFIKSSLTKQGDTSWAVPWGYTKVQILSRILISSSA